MKRILIIGGSGHARAVIDAVEQSQCYQIAGILDDQLESGSAVLGYRVLGRIDELSEVADHHGVTGGHVAIGDNWVRARVVARLEAAVPGFDFVTVVHPSATVSRHACLGRGVMVLSGAVIGPNSRVGQFCSVWTRASIDHDGTLDTYASLAPAVVTGGNVHIGAYSAVCLAASIIHGITIGEHTLVGAGSTVLNDLPNNAVAYGTPARVVRKRLAGERYL